eukprot:jgi/Mesen1/9619/ME000659S08992
MVFYFKVRPEVGDFTIYMGLDKFENEELIKYGLPEDICLEEEKGGHEGARCRKYRTRGQSCIDVMMSMWMSKLSPEGLASVATVGFYVFIFNHTLVLCFDHYTRKRPSRSPSLSLRLRRLCLPLTPAASPLVRTARVEKRLNDVVNRLNKTKVERTTDFKAEREAREAQDRAQRKAQLRDKNRREAEERAERERVAEMRSYKGLMAADKMTSNKDIASKGKSLQELEDDFMRGLGRCGVVYVRF